MTPERYLLLADSMAVNRHLMLLESLRLHLLPECLEGLLDVLLFFVLTAHRSKQEVRVSIELQLDFQFIFIQVGSGDCPARLGLLTVLPLGGAS
jgi:hypothetical protein